MFCKYCGNQLPDNANFCPKCGRINEDAIEEFKNEPVAEEPILTATPFPTKETVVAEEPVDPYAEEKSEMGGSILKFAILGLAFACTVWFSLLGLIFTLVAKGKVKEYIGRFNETEGRATVGKHLSNAGLAVSISFMVFTVLLVLLIIAAL